MTHLTVGRGKTVRRVLILVIAGVCTLYGSAPAFAHRSGSVDTGAIPTEKLQWKPCDEVIEELPQPVLECASLRVPLDYRKPKGKMISMAISRVQAAQTTQRRGVLLVNPGGPGGSGLGLALVLANIMPQEVVSQYDIIGFDPRGVGESNPISCGLTPQEGQQAMVPLTQKGSFEATSTFMRQVANRCWAQSGDVLPHMTTANTARDMDQLRKALGERKISFFGYSYGTYLGAVYSSLYKDRTDRFVLDSSVDPDGIWRDQFRSWRLADRDRFPDFARYLMERNAEYHLGETPQEIDATFAKLVERYNTSPLELIDGTIYNGELFRLSTFGALYSDSLFPDMAYIWQFLNELEIQPSTQGLQAMQTQLGRILPNQTSFAAVPEDNASASALAILCGDARWSREPWQYKKELQHDVRFAAKFGVMGSNIWPCAFWQDMKKEDVRISEEGERNIMIVQNKRDPATPYRGAREMRQELGRRAQLVTVDEGGHGVAYLHPNVCATNTVSAFLATGELGKRDSVCSAEAPEDDMQRFEARTTDTKARAQELLRKLVR